MLQNVCAVEETTCNMIFFLFLTWYNFYFINILLLETSTIYTLLNVGIVGISLQ